MTSIRVQVGRRDFEASGYAARHLPGQAPEVRVQIALPAPPELDTLRSWLGEPATIQGNATTPWEEVRKVTRVRSRDNEVEILARGTSVVLDGAPAARAWSETHAAAVAEDVLKRAGAKVRMHLQQQRATTQCPYLIQNHVSDRAFVNALARTYCFAVIDLAQGAVSLADAPPGRGHSINEFERSGTQTAHEFSVATEGRAATTFEKDGTFDRIEAGAAEPAPAQLHEEQSACLGYSPNREHLENLVEGRADSAAVHQRTTVKVVGGHFDVGDTIEGDVLDQTMAVAGRHTQLEGHGVVSMLELVPTAQLAAALSSENQHAPACPSLALAVIERSHIEDAPGWCALKLPDMDGDAQIPAQLIAPGGGRGSGQTHAPSEGAEVLVALIGEPLMPRVIVLGVCRHANNPPASADEAVFALQIGTREEGCILQIGSDGVTRLDAKSLKLAARDITLEGEAIDVVGTRTVRVASESIELARRKNA